ncbi:MAG: putative coiled-coil protein SlyX [Myxococcota bacterium]|jgi:uncharacterized coiled-coil protein SlyX
MSERIENIEVKLAYLEKRMIDLDAVVCDVGDAMMALRDELKEIRETASGDPGQPSVRRLEDEVPPHY